MQIAKKLNISAPLFALFFLIFTLGMSNVEASAAHSGWVHQNNTWYYYDQQGNKKTGWLLDGNTWYYLDTSGAMKTGWLYYGGVWYYLNSSGAMQTGWLLDGNTWYFLDSSGAMKTGWIYTGGVWYFLNSSGAMQTGWLLDGDTWYYLNSSGAMKTGWLYYGGVWYYLNSSGAMQTGWIEEGGKKYFLDSTGAMQTGWLEYNDKWYLLGENGALLKGPVNKPNDEQHNDSNTDNNNDNENRNEDSNKCNIIESESEDTKSQVNAIANIEATNQGWVCLDEVQYYFDEHGNKVTGPHLIDGTLYYFDNEGALQKGPHWLLHNDEWYYLSESGTLITGWFHDGKNWYYLDQLTGVMKTGWLRDNGDWYYLKPDGASKGAMLTGWVLDNGTWYYLRFNGKMHTGWLETGGTWYYLHETSGAMVTGWANINGTDYYFASNGAWIPNPKRTVFLDPGHGGTDPGATAGGYKESELNLAVALKVKSLLEAHNYIVHMSREDDSTVDLYDRPKMANELNVDILVSIHTNSIGTSSVHGIETYYYQYKPEYPPKINHDMHNDPDRVAKSKTLAELLHKRLIENTGAYDRGTKGAALVVTRETRMPAVLVELGFISNPTERQKMFTDDYQNKLAQAIADGIVDYFASN